MWAVRDRDRPEAHWGSSRPAGRVGAMWQKAFWSIAEAEKGFQEASWNGYLRGQGQSICRPASLAGSFWGASASIPGEKMSPLSVHWIPLVQSLSLVWLCSPMDCSTPGFHVLHHVPEFAQTHADWVGDAIQPSYPLSPSPPALNLSQRQGLGDAAFTMWQGQSMQSLLPGEELVHSHLSCFSLWPSTWDLSRGRSLWDKITESALLPSFT